MSISSRPDVSSEAQPATSVAAANPTMMNPSSMKTIWRKPPALVMSTFGKTLLKIAMVSGDRSLKASASEPLAAAMTNPKTPRPMPHARAVGSRSPNDRPTGPRTPRTALGRPGVAMALDAPRSRRENASVPSASSTIATRATGISDGQSVMPASGWWPAVHENHDRLAMAPRTGTNDE